MASGRLVGDRARGDTRRGIDRLGGAARDPRSPVAEGDRATVGDGAHRCRVGDLLARCRRVGGRGDRGCGGHRLIDGLCQRRAARQEVGVTDVTGSDRMTSDRGVRDRTGGHARRGVDRLGAAARYGRAAVGEDDRAAVGDGAHRCRVGDLHAHGGGVGRRGDCGGRRRSGQPSDHDQAVARLDACGRDGHDRRRGDEAASSTPAGPVAAAVWPAPGTAPAAVVAVAATSAASAAGPGPPARAADAEGSPRAAGVTRAAAAARCAGPAAAAAEAAAGVGSPDHADRARAASSAARARITTCDAATATAATGHDDASREGAVQRGRARSGAHVGGTAASAAGGRCGRTDGPDGDLQDLTCGDGDRRLGLAAETSRGV